jgi:hypothetical protein
VQLIRPLGCSCLIAVLASCAPSPLPRAPGAAYPPSVLFRATHQGVRLTVSSDVGEKPAIRVRLTNVGDVPIWLNGRMALRSRAERFSEVSLEILNVSRPSPGVSCSTCRGYAEDKDYVLLRPGGEFAQVVRLDCIATNFAEPWKAIFRYHDTNPKPPLPPRGAMWFSGEVASEVVEIGPFKGQP